MNSLNAYMHLIDKYFKKKKTILFVELLLENYNNRNLYFRIDFYKKDRVYKLSFIDLDHIESNNLEMWINTCNIEPDAVYFIEDFFNNSNFNNNMIEESENRVSINCYFKRHTHIEFTRFLPIELFSLTEFLIIIFNNSPKKIEGLFFEIVSLITGNNNKYTYNDIFKFDLFNGDIDKLFDKDEIIRGKKYYEDNQIKFLEKIDTRYFAVVEGADDYVIIIDYDENEKLTKLFCSCPSNSYCKHLYAVILAIRNNQFKKFYKLVYEKEKTTYLQRLMDFEFYLCIGLEQIGLKIVNKDGNIEVVPLMDANNKCYWKVIEDDDNMNLTKKINNVIKK